MNETIFLVHACLILFFVLGALRLGVGALTTLVSLLVVMANLFVVKQMVLFGFEVTCSDLYAVGAMFALNFIREYYGRNDADRAVWISFFCAFVFTAMAIMHLLYHPSSADWAHGAFMQILMPLPRLLMASFLAYVLSQKLDLFLFSWLKEKAPFLPFFLRTAMTVSLSQFCDTFLFTILGLTGIATSLISILAVSYAIKLIAIAALTPMTLLSRHVAVYRP